MSEWKKWFAWKPVTLLTAEIAWLKFVSRRKTTGAVPGNPSWAGDGTWQYADAYFSKPQTHISKRIKPDEYRLHEDGPERA